MRVRGAEQAESQVHSIQQEGDSGCAAERSFFQRVQPMLIPSARITLSQGRRWLMGWPRHNQGRVAHLQSAKRLAARRGTLQASVQQAVEGAWALIGGVHIVVLTIRLLASLVRVCKAKLGQHTACEQQPGCVRCRVVVQANLRARRPGWGEKPCEPKVSKDTAAQHWGKGGADTVQQQRMLCHRGLPDAHILGAAPMRCH